VLAAKTRASSSRKASDDGPRPGATTEAKRLDVVQKEAARDSASNQTKQSAIREGNIGSSVAPQPRIVSTSPVPLPAQPATSKENRTSGDKSNASEIRDVSVKPDAGPAFQPTKRQRTTLDDSTTDEPTGVRDGSVSTRAGIEGAETGAGRSLVTSEPPTEETVPSATKAQEPTRAAEALSSPGSTAHSATTPAVHDLSTNTSPDNDGVQYAEPGEEKAEQAESDDVVMEDTVPADDVESTLPAVTVEKTAANDAASQSKIVLTPLAGEGQPRKTLDKDSQQTNPGASPTPIAAPEVERRSRKSQSPLPVQTTDAAGPSGSRSEIPDSHEGSPVSPRDAVDKQGSQEKEPSGKPSSSTDKKVAQPSQLKSQSQTSISASQPQTTEANPVPERAVTRVSSGAMRQKSVSEILGETPRPSPSADKHGATAKGQPSAPATPSGIPRRGGGITKRKPKDRKHISTVVFGKQVARRPEGEKGIVASKQDDPSDDYFTPLFIEAFTSRSSWMKPLGTLLGQAHKTVSTADSQLAIDDDQACKLLKKVYMAQHSNKWSLRQRERCHEPIRPPTHWDQLLQEMNWMRTDFRYERRWKMAQASILAHACAAWVAGTPEERLGLQVPMNIPPAEDDSAAMTNDGRTDETSPISGLLPDEARDDEGVSPSAIFGLPEDQIVFPLQQSAAADMILSELPMFGSPLKVTSGDPLNPEYDPDATWRRPALPLSKYVEGGIRLVTDGKPAWKSAFEHDLESDDEEERQETPGPRKRAWAAAETNNVALFKPEFKTIRDRLHASHQFRPPTEHPMPSQSFYENRVASQWTMEEDEQLRSLAGEYSYNWSLISDILTPNTLFVGGAERRTPWECFERYLQLEPLPPDLAKTQFFRAYNQRIENSQRVLAQQHQVAAQNAAAQGLPPPKRKQSVPVRVEKRHNRRHINLFNAMVKVQKKRESVLQKQQAQANLIAMRKNNENAQQQQQRQPTINKTPRDYSLLRFERDQQMAERMQVYAQRQAAERRVSDAHATGAKVVASQQVVNTLQHQVQQARQVQQQASLAASAAAGQMPQNLAQQIGQANLAAAAAAAGRTGVPNQFGVPGQARPSIPMQANVNGIAGLPTHMQQNLLRQHAMNGINPQLQAMQGQQHRLPIATPPEAHVMMQAKRISEQQRQVQMQHQQAQQSQPGHTAGPSPVPQMAQQTATSLHGSPPNIRNGLNGINAQSFMSNAQSMLAASFNQGHATIPPGTPPSAGLHMGASAGAGSPAPRNPIGQIPPGLLNQIQALEAQYRQKNPAATPEQARQFAVEHFSRLMAAQRQTQQQAMNAAAGSPPPLPNGLSPAQYAALVRQQQLQMAMHAAQIARDPQTAAAAQAQATQAAQAQAAQHQRSSSGSATPGK